MIKKYNMKITQNRIDDFRKTISEIIVAEKQMNSKDVIENS